MVPHGRRFEPSIQLHEDDREEPPHALLPLHPPRRAAGEGWENAWGAREGAVGFSWAHTERHASRCYGWKGVRFFYGTAV